MAGYFGKIKLTGSQVIEAATRRTDSKKPKKQVGNDLRAR